MQSVRKAAPRSSGEGEFLLVRRRIETLVLTCGVVTPVGIEVTVVDQRAEPEDGFGAGEAPAGSGDVQAVADC